MKYLLKIAFAGMNYHGWQVQTGAPSVQGTLCAAAASLFGAPCAVTGCSRTDAGVSAKEYFCTLESPEDACVPPDRLPAAMNRFLPPDIALLEASECPSDFHARYSVKSKTYEYTILNSSARDPFLSGLVWQYDRPLDEAVMDAGAKLFCGTHDFSAFCASGTSVEDKKRTIFSSSVRREGDKVIFSVCGDGFLYNMVRIMAGTLVELSLSKISEETIALALNSGERSLCGATAPACGLCLTKVEYQ